MTWLSLGNVVSIVVEVKKFENDGESVSFQDLSGLGYNSMRCAIFFSNPRYYRTISPFQQTILGTVIIEVWNGPSRLL